MPGIVMRAVTRRSVLPNAVTLIDSFPVSDDESVRLG
jgi:hypothetical protein